MIQYPAVVAYIVRDDGLMLAVTRKDTRELSAPGGKCEPHVIANSFGAEYHRRALAHAGLIRLAS